MLLLIYKLKDLRSERLDLIVSICCKTPSRSSLLSGPTVRIRLATLSQSLSVVAQASILKFITFKPQLNLSAQIYGNVIIEYKRISHRVALEHSAKVVSELCMHVYIQRGI